MQTMTRAEWDILAVATDAFDDKLKAKRWLDQPSIELGNKRPIDMVNTVAGYRAVAHVLNNIKWGIPA